MSARRQQYLREIFTDERMRKWKLKYTFLITPTILKFDQENHLHNILSLQLINKAEIQFHVSNDPWTWILVEPKARSINLQKENETQIPQYGPNKLVQY